VIEYTDNSVQIVNPACSQDYFRTDVQPGQVTILRVVWSDTSSYALRGWR